MIITCERCLKKFEVKSSLIPENGRLLKCGSCDYQWFHKKTIDENKQLQDNKISEEEDIIEPKKVSRPIKKKIQTKSIKDKKDILDISPSLLDNNSETNNLKKTTKKKINFFSILLVFIISIISLVLVIDTFQEPISLLIPNIKIILNNLYETIKDIELFLKDLY